MIVITRKTPALLLFILLLSITSCARPNYQDSLTNGIKDQQDPPEQAPEKADNSQKCELRLNKLNICLSLQWAKKPSLDNYNSFFLVIENSANTKLDDNFVKNLFSKMKIILWMPSMGHGSTPIKLSLENNHTIKAEQVYFLMEGNWEIRIQINEESTVYDQVIYPITL